MRKPDTALIGNLRFAGIAVCGGLLVSGLAFVVMGTNFGFENVTPQAVTPGFFVGFVATFTITLLVARGRRLLADRLAVEQAMSAALRAEIEENRRLQRSLEDTSRRNRTVIDAAPTGIIVHADGKVVFANASAVKMFGLDAEKDLIGIEALDLVHEDDREIVYQYRRRRAEKRGGPDEVRVRRLRRDGSVFWSESTARGLTFGGEDATMVMIQDVSDQVGLERELQINQERFRDFAEASADWFWETDHAHRIRYVSQGIERLTGAPPDWHYGKTRFELMGNSPPDEDWDRHLKDLDAQRPFRNFEYLRRGEGKIEARWIRTSGVPFYDENGRFLGYRGSGTDITELKQAEARLREREAELAEARSVAAGGDATSD